jgi:hypothetical protein
MTRLSLHLLIEVVVKLIDFEFAYQYGGDETYLDTGCYTSGYMPLECQRLDFAGTRVTLPRIHLRHRGGAWR